MIRALTAHGPDGFETDYSLWDWVVTIPGPLVVAAPRYDDPAVRRWTSGLVVRMTPYQLFPPNAVPPTYQHTVPGLRHTLHWLFPDTPPAFNAFVLPVVRATCHPFI